MATKELTLSLETSLMFVIDGFLSDTRYATIVEGWKVRDLLLDLRAMVMSTEGQTVLQ